MIALDTSALVAIALQEADGDTFQAAIEAAGETLIGAPTMLETRMVLTGKLGSVSVDAILPLLWPEGFRPIAFDARHLAAAAAAFTRYGKGLHPAALNYGDCMAYAVAAVAGCPLLYKGDDFARTDIRSAL